MWEEERVVEVIEAALTPTTLRTNLSVTLLSQTCPTSCSKFVQEVEGSGALPQLCTVV